MKQKRNSRKAFTLVELLVVIAIIGILAALLFPTLARAKFKAKVASCTSNYHQWAVAVTLYADDNRGNLPSFIVPAYIGKNPWDVSTNMVPALKPQNVIVAMMFCPARVKDFQDADNWCAQNLNHKLISMEDLNAYQSAVFGDFGLLFHSWWVPRYAGEPADGGTLFPAPTAGTGDPNGWPRRLDDPMVNTQPILTDRCQYYSSDPPDISQATDGHPFGGSIVSVNAMYGDGHVETRSRDKLKWRYSGSYYGQPQYSFY